MKRLFSIFVCLIVILSALSINTFAAEVKEESITYFEDGSYCISTITQAPNPMQPNYLAASAKTKTGTKTSKYYNSDNVLCFTVKVTGTFTYNGSTAKATAASYSYSIGNTAWHFSSGKATYSGATATATCVFRHTILTRTLTSSLTCSPTGVLS